MKSKINTLMRIIIATMLIVILGTSSIVVVSAAATPPIEIVYSKSGIAATSTYNKTKISENNNTPSYENNINKNSENIIVIGDSRTCQLINLDFKTKKRMSGYSVWGQSYNKGINNNTSDNYIKTKLINPALNSDKPCHIWIFGTINETYGDKNATKLISYAKELKNYCISKNKNKEVTIHVVKTVGGTSNWSLANQNVSAYNTAINNAFNKNILIGDVDQDGSVNITDATSIQKYIAKIKTLNKDQLIAADANGDGSVDILDATTIQKYIAAISVNSLIGTYNNGKENTSHVKMIAEDYSPAVYGKDSSFTKKYFSGTPVLGYTYTSAANAKKYTKDGKHGTVTTTVNNNNKGGDDGLHYNVNTLECIGNWIINNSKK